MKIIARDIVGNTTLDLGDYHRIEFGDTQATRILIGVDRYGRIMVRADNAIVVRPIASNTVQVEAEP